MKLTKKDEKLFKLNADILPAEEDAFGIHSEIHLPKNDCVVGVLSLKDALSVLARELPAVHKVIVATWGTPEMHAYIRRVMLDRIFGTVSNDAFNAILHISKLN